MKVTPVKQYSQPNFPARSIIDEHPELLRLVPRRWQKNPAVLTALAATAALMSGVTCAAKATHETVNRVYDRAMLGGDIAVNIVIPSEEDARQVICEEAKKAGIKFKPDSRRIDLRGLEKKAANMQPKNVDAKLNLNILMDGTDAQRNISYEYVSQADTETWDETIASQNFYVGRSVNDYALALNNVLPNAAPKGHYKVFAASAEVPQIIYVKDSKGRYDEKANDRKRKAAEQQALGEAREKLRAQVRDFVNWLKAEGVI